jgi:hypothetical protein
LILVTQLDRLRIDRIGNLDVTLRLGRICMTTAVLLLAGISTSHSQINPFRSNTQTDGLTNADVDMLFATAGQVNSKDPIHVGDTEAWSNPTSGNSGKVTVTRLFESDGLTCHTLRYDVAYRAQRPPRTYSTDWCKTKAGEWKIKS